MLTHPKNSDGLLFFRNFFNWSWTYLKESDILYGPSEYYDLHQSGKLSNVQKLSNELDFTM